MFSSDWIRWSGLSAICGGLLIVVKGGVIALANVDLAVTPFAFFLFALGLVGLRARLGRQAGRLGTIGGFLVYIGVLASFVGMVFVGLRLPLPQPDDPNAPIYVRVILLGGFLGILLGQVSLGLSAWRAEIMSGRWRAAPLVIALLWFPPYELHHMDVGPSISGGVLEGAGYIVAGLVWIFLGLLIWTRAGEKAV